MHKLHFAFDARSFDDCIEDLLMEGGNLLAPLLMSSLEHNEIGILAEWSGEVLAVAFIPGINHLQRDTVDDLSVITAWSSHRLVFLE